MSRIRQLAVDVMPGDFDGDGDGKPDGDLDGDGVVDTDFYLAHGSGNIWKVWRSADGGKTWEMWAKFGVNINYETLFYHQGGVYLMGRLKRPEGDAKGAGCVVWPCVDNVQSCNSLLGLALQHFECQLGYIAANT